MEGGGELKDVATLLGAVSDGGVGVASVLQGAGVELKGVDEVVVEVEVEVAAAAVLTTGAALGATVEDMNAAEGTKGLASTLRPEPTVGGSVGAGAAKGGLVDKVDKVGGRSGVHLRTDEDCAETVSVGVDFIREAVAREGVLVIGVVVCESGAEPGGVWRTESRKEKVWETGLRLSPVIRAKLPLTSPDMLLLAAAPDAKPMLGSGLLVGAFSSFALCPSLTDTGKSSTHMGS